MATTNGSASRGTTPAVALALQGGGGLGAYHIGAYEALAEDHLLPDWVCGTSIGAFNAAVIAGNRPDERVERLTGFWDAISRPDVFLPEHATALRYLHNMVSYTGAVVFGQPDFFAPRNPFTLFLPDAPSQDVSFYDTTPVLATLQRFATFPVAYDAAVRLSLGVTDVESGTVHYFDSQRERIGPSHVLASGSLPPGFPATSIDGRLYWDGACVSNTPLDEIVARSGHAHLVVFVIDLWSLTGKAPRNMNEVLWRAKQIQYASRSRYHLDTAVACARLSQAAQQLRTHDAAAASAAPKAPAFQRLDIVHVVYRPGPDQVPGSDAEFSRESIAERRAAGYADLKAAISKKPWLTEKSPAHLGVVVHRVENGRVTTEAAGAAQEAPAEAGQS
ncbi:patatin-like phospholipase family protein [Paraburkholderia oxyphila]|uniref:patatin-like phospholipase family protein n=1 Tax=Paraburkholderia oxyphila TaxID=614212 RepID=UPI0005B9A90D|nr:patatin-like phospholipase family protein [Paraburkholderia oxyphila]